MCTAIEEGVIQTGDYIILENLDRLSRKGIHKTIELLNTILEKGVYVVSLQDKLKLDEQSLNNIQDIMRIAISADLSYQESLKKQDRLTKAWAAKQTEAKKSGKPKTSTCPAWLSVSEDKSKFIIDEDKATIVKTIFELSANGMGRRKICEHLTNSNITTIGKSNKWYPSYIAKLISNGAVIGRLTPSKLSDGGKRIPDISNTLENYYPPIITSDLYLRVSEAKAARGKQFGGRKGSNFSNLLQGLVKCLSCSESMTYQVKNKAKQETYLRCHNSLIGQCSNIQAYRYGLIEEAFLNIIKSDNKELHSVTSTSELEQDIARKEITVKALTKKITKLIAIDLDLKELTSSLLDLKTERTEAESILSQLKAKLAEQKPAVIAEFWDTLKQDILAKDELARFRFNSYIRSKGIQLVFHEHLIYVTHKAGKFRANSHWLKLDGTALTCTCEAHEDREIILFTSNLKSGKITTTYSEDYIRMPI
jgi:DNA invertase Pin-like site-specific DNA recombinase